MACIDQWIILAYVQILLDSWAIGFKFHDRINQRLISFQSAISRTAQGNKRFYASRWSMKLCPASNKCPWSMQGAYFWSHVRSVNQCVQISQGSWLMSLTTSYTFYTRSIAYIPARGSRFTSFVISYTFYTCIAAYKKQGATNRCSIQLLLLLACALLCTKRKGLPIDALYSFYYFQHAYHRVQKARGYLGMCSRFNIWLTKFSKVFAAQQISSMVWLDP
jgi:hypothetical protein